MSKHLQTDMSLLNSSKECPLMSKNYMFQNRGHEFAKSGNISELETFLNSPHINVFEKDDRGRTVLHHAASFRVEGVALKMAKLILVSNGFKGKDGMKNQEKVNLINVQDNQCETSMHLAIKKRYQKVVEFLVLNGADLNLKSREDKKPIELIYQYLPLAMLAAFDRSVSWISGDIDEENFRVLFNFRDIIGHTDREDISGNLDTRYETKLLANALYETEMNYDEILVHPLVHIFLREKWKKYRILFLASVLFHMTWLSFYTAFILDLYVYKCPYLHDDSGADLQCAVTSLGSVFTVSLVFTIILTIIVGFKEFFQMFNQPSFRMYVSSLKNNGQVFQIVLITITIWPALFVFAGRSSLIILSPYHYQTAASGLLLAWTLIVSQIGKAPQLRIYVDIMYKVLRSFGLFVMTYVFLLTGFAFAFSVLMPRNEMFQPHLAFPTLLSMMVGELNYHDLFFNDEIAKDRSILPFPISGHIVFAAFTIVVTIILFNLLIGFTVSDIQVSQNKATVSRLSNQLHQIHYMERFLFSSNMQTLSRFLRLHKTLQQKFLIGPSRPSSEILNNVNTFRNKLIRETSSTYDVETFSGSENIGNVECNSMRQRGSNFKIKKRSIVMPIKLIPRTLIKEVRRLAVINSSSSSSTSEDRCLSNSVLFEMEEMRSQFRTALEKLNCIISQLDTPNQQM